MSEFDDVMERIYEVTGVRTQAGLAEVLGIAQPTVSDAKKRNSIPMKWYLKLFQKMGANPEWLESGLGPKFLRAYGVDEQSGEEVPLNFRQTGSGYGASMPEGMRLAKVYSMSRFDGDGSDKSESLGTFCVPEDFDSPDLLVVKMESSNMEPLIRRGALVGLDRGDTRLISGEIYGLRLPYEGLVIRRLYLEPEEGQLVLSSQSEVHADKRVPLDEYAPKVVGRAAWAMQPL